MRYSISWSSRAKLTYFNTLDFLNRNWSYKELLNFMTRTEEVLEFIAGEPTIYPVSNKKGIHKCVIVKQVSLYYKVIDKEIQILVFWDNRQNPKKLRL